jgi:hypothetical protein
MANQDYESLPYPMREERNMGYLLDEVQLGNSQDHSLKIIAKSIFKELRGSGYKGKHVVSLCTELLGLVISNVETEKTTEAKAKIAVLKEVREKRAK